MAAGAAWTILRLGLAGPLTSTPLVEDLKRWPMVVRDFERVRPMALTRIRQNVPRHRPGGDYERALGQTYNGEPDALSEAEWTRADRPVVVGRPVARPGELPAHSGVAMNGLSTGWRIPGVCARSWVTGCSGRKLQRHRLGARQPPRGRTLPD
jgi:hypothetical protein